MHTKNKVTNLENQWVLGNDEQISTTPKHPYQY